VTERPAPWKRRSFGFHVQLEAWSGIVERLRGTPVRARALASGSSEERLGRRPDPRSWSAKEHIGHLVDLEALDVRRLAQYLAGAETYGQILLGLSKPCADLSRGASEDDILGVAAILGLQAIEYRKLYPNEA